MPRQGFSFARMGRKPRASGVVVGLAVLLLLFVSGLSNPARAAPAAQAGSPGETLFQAKCAACHTVGKGKLVGPDLQDITTRRDADWLKRFIANPDALFAANDPTAQQLLAEYNNVKMPAVGLTDAEIDALLGYLGSGAAAAAPAAQAQPALPPGDPVAGWRIFSGHAGLVNGGPSCIGCHTVSGLGGLGGGALGPDLTLASQRYPGPALASVLGNITFPTMIGPFANRALTPQEQADLVAYLAQVDQGQAAAAPASMVVAAGAITQDLWVITAIGLGGMLALTVLLAVFWPRQRQSVSSRLRNARKPAVD